MKKKAFVSVIIVLALSVACGCAVLVHDSQTVFNGSRVMNPDRYSLEFSRMNKADSGILKLEAGDEILCDWNISRGRVDITIGMEGSAHIYKGNRLDSASFTLPVSETGSYLVSVEARNASGRLEIRKK